MSCWVRRKREGVAHLARRDALARVVQERLLQEVDRLGRRGAEQRAEVAARLRVKLCAVAELAEALQVRAARRRRVSELPRRGRARQGGGGATHRPVLVCWRSQRSKDHVELLHVALGGHEGHAEHELGKDAARCPHVDARRVGPRAEQELWTAVPPVRSVRSARLSASQPVADVVEDR